MYSVTLYLITLLLICNGIYALDAEEVAYLTHNINHLTGLPSTWTLSNVASACTSFAANLYCDSTDSHIQQLFYLNVTGTMADSARLDHLEILSIRNSPNLTYTTWNRTDYASMRAVTLLNAGPVPLHLGLVTSMPNTTWRLSDNAHATGTLNLTQLPVTLAYFEMNRLPNMFCPTFTIAQLAQCNMSGSDFCVATDQMVCGHLPKNCQQTSCPHGPDRGNQSNICAYTDKILLPQLLCNDSAGMERNDTVWHVDNSTVDTNVNTIDIGSFNVSLYNSSLILTRNLDYNNVSNTLTLTNGSRMIVSNESSLILSVNARNLSVGSYTLIRADDSSQLAHFEHVSVQNAASTCTRVEQSSRAVILQVVDSCQPDEPLIPNNPSDSLTPSLQTTSKENRWMVPLIATTCVVAVLLVAIVAFVVTYRNNQSLREMLTPHRRTRPVSE